LKKSLFFIFALIAVFIATESFTEGIHDVTLSSYASSVAEQEHPVKVNIRIASSRLNGIEILPGGTFSFNETVGEGNSANGYLSGRVLYMDMTAYEPGGGICQVSSTLFNALLLSGCIIIERHRHARPVTYVPLGLDATIRYGKKDLRMKNPHRQSIFIYTSMNDSTLLITVKAGNRLKTSYELFTDEEEVNIPFGDSNERRIKPGITIYVYRKKLKNGSPLETALLYKDFYPPVYTE